MYSAIKITISMKRILLLFVSLFTLVAGNAQSTTFSIIGEHNVKLWFRVLAGSYSYQKSYDASVDEVAFIYPADGVNYPSNKPIVIPSTVDYGGKTYQVTYLSDAFLYTQIDSIYFPSSIKKSEGNFIYSGTVKHLCTPENLEVIPQNWLNHATIEEVWISPNVKKVEWLGLSGEAFTRKRIHGLAQSKIEEIGNWSFIAHQYSTDPSNYIKDMSVLPPTIRIIGDEPFSIRNSGQGLPLDKFSVPPTIERIGKEVYDIAQRVDVPHTTPFTLGENTFGTQATLKIFIPTDCSAAYKAATNWSSYNDKFREEIKIGATGYTSYYLENENFLIPTGCTAYIITGITPSGSKSIPDQANVTAFTAGKIIPKQTGFILQGTPNSTVVYQANVTGTEESVAGNWLVGTAIEQEFSSAGHKYYVLANGDEGIGFYKQGTRKGASIKLQPHRAGLRLADAVAPAKGLIIDFDAAREEAETTGIRDVRPSVQPREDIIYDLQGRRVKNPGQGIYIVNGKKVVRE